MLRRRFLEGFSHVALQGYETIGLVGGLRFLNLEGLKRNSGGLKRKFRSVLNLGPTFPERFSLLENAQTLAGIACRTPGKLGKSFPGSRKTQKKTSSRKRVSDSHSLF